MPTFSFEIKRQMTEVVRIIMDGATQEAAADLAYEIALDDGGQIISRERGNLVPHIIEIEEIG